jgi:hypothetical protein
MQNEKFTNEQITQYISDWQTSGLSYIDELFLILD